MASGVSGAVEVQVRVVDLGTRSATTGSADVLDKEVYIDNARCVPASLRAFVRVSRAGDDLEEIRAPRFCVYLNYILVLIFGSDFILNW